VRVLAVMLASGVLAGCQSADYGLGEGDANYDALAHATKDCEAQGGHVAQKTGYDSRELSSYVCKMGKAK
jgi:hypothetical protein